MANFASLFVLLIETKPRWMNICHVLNKFYNLYFAWKYGLKHQLASTKPEFIFINFSIFSNKCSLVFEKIFKGQDRRVENNGSIYYAEM